MLARLYEFNHWANGEYLNSLADLHNEPRAMEWMTHIIEAQYIWNQRLLSREMNLTIFKEATLEFLSKYNQTNYEETILILKTLNLQEYIVYKNLKGDEYSNKKEDILHHVVNHSTYHRAQIATLLKSNGLKVPSTDYIFYVRKMKY